MDGLRLDLDVLGGECGSDGDGAGSGGLVDVQDDPHGSAGRYLIRDGLFNDGYGRGGDDWLLNDSASVRKGEGNDGGSDSDRDEAFDEFGSDNNTLRDNVASYVIDSLESFLFTLSGHGNGHGDDGSYS